MSAPGPGSRWMFVSLLIMRIPAVRRFWVIVANLPPPVPRNVNVIGFDMDKLLVFGGVFGFLFRAVALLCALLDPLHYMILLGSKYEPNMNREARVQLSKMPRLSLTRV